MIYRSALKFTDTGNIDLTAAKFADNPVAKTQIGLTSNATILGKEFTLTDDIGAVTVEANTINLKNNTALTTTGVKANSVLNVGTKTQAKKVILTLGHFYKSKT